MSMENARGVLLLSHVGFSFMEDLASAVTARGLEIYVLSSLPEEEHRAARPGQLADLADDVRVTAAHVLTPDDVESYLDHLHRTGRDVACCLTVWEGYRPLMALANARLGVPDLDEKQALALRDKLTLRNRLADAGLSNARARALTPDTLAAHQRGDGRYFVKPVSGIASFGTFPLTPDTTWTDLEALAAEARADTVYASALTSAEHGTPDVRFLVEDYVPGRECSFEVLAVDGVPHVVAVHEKCEVTETAGAVLENACVSPPVGLTTGQIADGLTWVRRVFDLLGLDWGCFHIEARHTPEHGWDLIEVNPRVGGSLISPSVAELTGGTGLLALWLDLLLAARRPAHFTRFLAGLSYTADGTPPSPNATYFRVFFADPGTLRHVAPNDRLPLAPVLTQIFLHAGDVVAHSAREVFLGQVLWRMDLADRDDVLARLVPASAHAIETAYEPAPGTEQR
ncbi:ATP-grasp domain-containing protein [Streptomyces capillispiralis]|uniref:ATP-grasp domain-containing protein n=2 Tax=Streptomyces capillispiralis TaxID=68182 RepID=A0A561TBH5_9ACTN|nr:ATP-grasp domain-containing protein [Streptomyces capillispiralis]